MILKETITSILDFVDRYFYLLLVAVSALIFVFNYNSMVMESLLSNYVDYTKIMSGFNKDVIEATATPTFPMWGYGWVFALTENRFAIFLFQIVAANLALLYLLRTLKDFQLFDSINHQFFQLLIILSIPYFAINISLSPYGLANTLFVLSFAFLLRGVNKNNARYFIISGLVFGLTLNFRSDLVYFPILLLAILMFTTRTNRTKKITLSFFPWLVAAFVVMAPWGMYTKHVTGHYLFGSTNSGHVFFVGLGQLPNNTWGITPLDGDAVMSKEIEEHFGIKQSSLIYESDAFLKKSFIKKVRQEPVEYVKKCLYSFARSLVDGAYSGQYYLFNAVSSKEGRQSGSIEYEKWRAKVMSNPLHVFDEMRIGNISQMVIELFVVAMKFVSMLLLPVTLWYGIQKRDFFSLSVAAAILYQLAVLVFAYNMRLYSVNVYIFYMMNIVLAVAHLKSRRPKTGSSKVLA